MSASIRSEVEDGKKVLVVTTNDAASKGFLKGVLHATPGCKQFPIDLMLPEDVILEMNLPHIVALTATDFTWNEVSAECALKILAEHLRPTLFTNKNERTQR